MSLVSRRMFYAVHNSVRCLPDKCLSSSSESNNSSETPSALQPELHSAGVKHNSTS